MSYYIDQDGKLQVGGESSSSSFIDEVRDVFAHPDPESPSVKDSPPGRAHGGQGTGPLDDASQSVEDVAGGRSSGRLLPNSIDTLEPMKPALSPKQRRVARVLDDDLVRLVSETVLILRDEYQVEPEEIDSSWLAAAILEDWTPRELAQVWMENQYDGP
jgi:hypothetical protein